MSPHNWFGAVGDAVRRGPPGAGNRGVLRPLTPGSKDVAAGTRINIVLFVISRPNRVQNQRKYVCRLVGGTSVRYLAANRFLYANGVFGCVPFQNETAGREKTCGFE